MINELRINVAEFLGTALINKKYFFVDYWTIVHFASGILIMFLIFKLCKKMKLEYKFALLFLLIAFWEVYELNASWIKLEKSVDIIYDLIVGLFGGYLFYYFRENGSVFSR